MSAVTTNNTPDFGTDASVLGMDDVICKNLDGLAVPILIAVISAVGLVANSIVVFIIVALREYSKSVTNIYVLQLAIADSIFLFQLPFHSRTMVLGKWTYGSLWCKLSESIKMLNYYASIMFLTLMSVDRYLAINFAMNQKVAKLRTKRAAFINSCFFWILAWMSTINILTYADVTECHCEIVFPSEYLNASAYYDLTGDNSGDLSGYDEYDDYTQSENSTNYVDFTSQIDYILNDDSACSLVRASKYFKTWVYCNFILAFLLPLVIICLSYALIIRRILRPMVVGTKSQKSNRTRKRVTFMVIALVSAFVVCWLPYHGFNLARINDVKLYAHPCKVLENFTLVLAYSNSAINPFFYTFLGTNFRQRWGNAVGKARKGLRQSILSHSGDYTPGLSMKPRRKSSAASSAGLNKNRDDVSVNSFVTKHTVVPTNTILKEDAL